MLGLPQARGQGPAQEPATLLLPPGRERGATPLQVQRAYEASLQQERALVQVLQQELVQEQVRGQAQQRGPAREQVRQRGPAQGQEQLPQTAAAQPLQPLHVGQRAALPQSLTHGWRQQQRHAAALRLSPGQWTMLLPLQRHHGRLPQTTRALLLRCCEPQLQTARVQPQRQHVQTGQARCWSRESQRQQAGQRQAQKTTHARRPLRCRHGCQHHQQRLLRQLLCA